MASLVTSFLGGLALQGKPPTGLAWLAIALFLITTAAVLYVLASRPGWRFRTRPSVIIGQYVEGNPPAPAWQMRKQLAEHLETDFDANEERMGSLFRVLQVANDDPDAEAKLDRLAAGQAEMPAGWNWRQRWSAEEVGRCRRCRRVSHTAGPDGQPWHPYCWGNPNPPPRAARRKRPRKGRGR